MTKKEEEAPGASATDRVGLLLACQEMYCARMYTYYNVAVVR